MVEPSAVAQLLYIFVLRHHGLYETEGAPVGVHCNDDPPYHAAADVGASMTAVRAMRVDRSAARGDSVKGAGAMKGQSKGKRSDGGKGDAGQGVGGKAGDGKRRAGRGGGRY